MKKILLWAYTAWLGFSYYIFRYWIMAIPLYTLRHFFIRRTVSRFGKHSSCLMHIDIRNGKNISIGDNTVINSRVLLDGRGGNIVIGNNVDIAQQRISGHLNMMYTVTHIQHMAVM